MAEITLATIFSTAVGIVAHLVFYPVIEAFNNQRMKRLARPAIGVLCNAPVFVVWLWVFKKNGINGLVGSFAAYCVSFLWNGAGVALGYLIGDIKNGN